MPASRLRWRRLVATIGAIAAVVLFLRAGTALVVSAPIESPDAIVSLASHEWERLPAAAQLAAQHPLAVVLLTIPRDVTIHTCHRCSDRVDDLVREGVARGRIRTLALDAPGTYGEARGTLDTVRSLGVRRLLVVTSPYHTRRALAVFRSVFADSGIEIGMQPAVVSSPARPRWWWLHGYDWAYVAYEWAATAHYAVKYGVSPL
jgi:uncharacterized SAM-binding protein YcdF (DUF218 family)